MLQSASLRGFAADPQPLQSSGQPRPRCRFDEIDLIGVARELGIAGYARRTIIAKLRLLAGQAHFPLPKTPRFVAGERRTGADAIDAGSLWRRDEVEQWLDNDRPPPQAEVATARRRSDVRAELGRRAEALVLVSSHG